MTDALGTCMTNALRATRKAAIEMEKVLVATGLAQGHPAVRAQAELAYWAGMALMYGGFGCDDPYDPLPRAKNGGDGMATEPAASREAPVQGTLG